MIHVYNLMESVWWESILCRCLFDAYLTIEVNGEPETVIKNLKSVVKETQIVCSKVLYKYEAQRL